jgi:hypothetical protein
MRLDAGGGGGVKRWLINLLAAASLLVFVAAAVLWVRSYWWCDYPKFRGLNKSLAMCTGRATARFSVADFIPPAKYPRASWDIEPPRPNMTEGRGGDNLLHVGSFSLDHGPNGEGTYTGVVVPFWAIMAVAAVAPAVVMWRRRHHFQPGVCRVCGYDLRATPDRCPECGRVVEATR